MAVKFECGDFALFQETLKKMRDIDDKIIYALNTSIPTESFKGQLSATETCKDLHGKLTVAHEDRCKLIKKCIAVTADKVKDLKTQKDDASAYKIFKSEQRKTCGNMSNMQKRMDDENIANKIVNENMLRMLQSELNVEDIVNERTNKTFYERCRPYFHDNNAL